ETLEKLEEERASGAFEKYAKKEQLKKIEEINRLIRNFDGLRRLKKLPDIVVIIDPAYNSLALREAKRANIATVALADTNVDLRAIEYPIPANNDARQAVAYMLGRMKEAILSGRLSALSVENQLPTASLENKAEGE
ncbi:MAG: 30S ribosomal protein S2, partial [Candidatus Sungbacteria bacterium]|nr:30S ribosomal protein S2 [Candidatus Sungbacteria bacterium]